MYKPQSQACDVPNSATPISPSQISASQQILTAMSNLVANANSAMAQIVARPDLNAAGQPMPVNAQGQPVALAPGSPVRSFDTSPVPPATSQILQRWPQMCTGVSLAAEGVPSPRSCLVIPPAVASVPKLTLPPVGVAAPPPTPPPAPAALPSGWKPPSTGNVCMDIQKGYVQQSQVSPEQLAKCSELQYYMMGNNPPPEPLRSQLQQYFSQNAGKLPNIPDQPNVPPYHPGMSGYRGMGDFCGCFASLAAVGLGAGLLWLLSQRRGFAL